MTTYLALLRGVNVGGKSKVSMAELALALSQAGLRDVHTYINSGNVFFSSNETDSLKLAAKINKIIARDFQVDVQVVVLSQAQWKVIIAAAPKDWGVDKTWQHNLLVLIPPFDMKEALEAVGDLKPDIESIIAGKGVLYQSTCLAQFGRTTTSKLIGKPIYKKMTIRNYNTATKLLSLF